MRWHRRPFGYLSHDGRWFIERGGEWEGPRGGVDPTRHMWLVWRLAVEGVDYEVDEFGPYSTRVNFGVSAVRVLSEVTGNPDDGEAQVMAHVFDEGWLADAKATVEAEIAKAA